jgi:hypothetical protein
MNMTIPQFERFVYACDRFDAEMEALYYEEVRPRTIDDFDIDMTDCDRLYEVSPVNYYSNENLMRLEQELESCTDPKREAALRLEIEEIYAVHREDAEAYSDWLHETGQLDP